MQSTKMNTNFIVFSQARSGSTWLVNTLNNIQSVTSYGELFLNDATMYKDGDTEMPRFLLWRQARRGFRPLLTYKYLANVFGGKQTNGFKLMYPQLIKFPEIATSVILYRVRIIHLIRKNILSAVLSNLIAQQRGRYHYMRGEEIPEEKLITIDPLLLVNKIRVIEKRTQRVGNLLKILRLKHIEVYYEDLSVNKQNFKPIWDFIEADFGANPPNWKFKKIRRKSPEETIQNYAEVHEVLKIAGYERFFS